MYQSDTSIKDNVKKTRSTSKSPRRITTITEKEYIMEEYDRGARVTDIAETLGMKIQTVTSIIVRKTGHPLSKRNMQLEASKLLGLPTKKNSVAENKVNIQFRISIIIITNQFSYINVYV